MSEHHTAHMPRVGVIASTFPRPVDAYLLRELLGLVEQGIDLRIYSLLHPGRNALPRSAAALDQATSYAPHLASGAMVAAHREFLLAAPGHYLGTLAVLIRAHAASPRQLAKVVAVWPQTVYFASRARRDRLDHVHANWATYPAAAALAIGRLTGLPWSFAGHATDIYIETAGLAQKIRAATFVTTCTAESQRYLTNLAGDDNGHRVHTVYHGTDLSAFRIERVEPPDLHVLAVGTLRHCKGFDTLLRAAARLNADGVPTRLTIVGDGEERARLSQLAHRLGINGQVTFTGYVPHEDLGTIYARASVLVLPARGDTHFGIPNVIIEAQAASLPVVCTPLPALTELIEDGASGLYVPEGDVDRLVGTLKGLFEDPDRRRRLAEQGLKRVTERFDISETAVAFARLFSCHPEESERRAARSKAEAGSQ